MSNFDEKSGVVKCATPWGSWWQTIEEVYAEVNVADGTRGKEVVCDISAKKLKLAVRGKLIMEGEFPSPVQADDSVWTLEDKKKIEICLCKTHKTAGSGWRCFLIGQYEADEFTFDEMEKKLTLQRYQFENPGMDFSGASISGGYQGGGPDLPGS